MENDSGRSSPTPQTPVSGTDLEWQKWGEQDPYFAVITEPRFRSANLTAEAKQQFFDSGRIDSCQSG